jgi:histidinol-phosphate aminotransferase
MAHYDLNTYIRNYQLKDYGKGGAPEGTVLDCSLGVNAEGIPAGVTDALKSISMDTLKYYPHDESILDEIATYYQHKSKSLSNWFTRNYIYLGNGTIDILHSLNVLCLTKGARVLGHAPQFTAYVDQVNCLGAIYDSYKMAKNNNYLFVTQSDDSKVPAYTNQMKDDHSLFIVENPNNPTGQIIDIKNIAIIANKARSLGKILIVDEAYGDYMPIENSAINLVPDYANVVVTRTFSKGFGMAGIRLGYLITSNEQITDTLTQLKKIKNQFNCNSIARILGMAFLQSGAKIPNLISVENSKIAVRRAIKKLHIATTGDTTPIMMLYYDTSQPDFNLQTFLFNEVKLWTVSCTTFDQLDSRAVRLMLPNPENIDLLAGMISEAEYKLPPL